MESCLGSVKDWEVNFGKGKKEMKWKEREKGR